MKIEILGAESLGVRGLCCLVFFENRRAVIDPGVALGYIRHGFMPHPSQVAVGARIRERIIYELTQATDVIFSHFHGDHVPLSDANPYQLPLLAVSNSLAGCCLFGPDPLNLDDRQLKRRQDIVDAAGVKMDVAEGAPRGPFSFSPPMGHGERAGGRGTVMMTKIEGEGEVFVHASDIQLLERDAVDFIIGWKPDVLIAGGPPLYLSALSKAHREAAWENALRLAEGVEEVIFDHHLLRSREGVLWLDALRRRFGERIGCAADYMGRKRRFLEASRKELYADMPVPRGWHREYAEGRKDAWGFLQRLEAPAGKSKTGQDR
ncbi:MAG: hypothetical protein ACLFN0_09710 [Thermovirgaceae bacterium]